MKTCEQCGAIFERPAHYSRAQWVARRYCSRRCLRAPVKPCAVESCVNQARGHGGLCNLHRQRMRKHGDPLHERWPDTLSRVMARIRKGNCWEWTGSLFQQTGYGQVWAGGTTRLAHRVVYELLVGAIPDGLELDHLCRNRACVNPAHLEPVTGKENIRRGHAARKAAIA